MWTVLFGILQFRAFHYRSPNTTTLAIVSSYLVYISFQYSYPGAFLKINYSVFKINVTICSLTIFSSIQERTLASKNELELAESLDELRELNRRTVSVDYESMLKRYHRYHMQ